jgi:hypothetical protein
MTLDKENFIKFIDENFTERSIFDFTVGNHKTTGGEVIAPSRYNKYYINYPTTETRSLDVMVKTTS